LLENASSRFEQEHLHKQEYEQYQQRQEKVRWSSQPIDKRIDVVTDSLIEAGGSVTDRIKDAFAILLTIGIVGLYVWATFAPFFYIHDAGDAATVILWAAWMMYLAYVLVKEVIRGGRNPL
jgi:hypothetical protein